MPLKHLLILLIPIVHHNYPVRSISGLGVGNLQYIYIQKAICIFIAGFPSDLGPVEPPLSCSTGVIWTGRKGQRTWSPCWQTPRTLSQFCSCFSARWCPQFLTKRNLLGKHPTISHESLTNGLLAAALTPKQMGLPEITGGKGKATFQKEFHWKTFCKILQIHTKSLESTELVPWLELEMHPVFPKLSHEDAEWQNNTRISILYQI